MFHWLRKAATPRPAPPVPDGVRLYAIGDVHGRADLLQRLHALIREDARTAAEPERRIVYLGDYIDRGAQSREVIDLLVDDPLDGFDTIHLKGNHEAALLGFLADPVDGARWLYFGGDATLASYGIVPPDADNIFGLQRAQQALAARLPPRHRRFFDELHLHYREGGLFFVHAGVDPDRPIEHQSPDDLMWIRDKFLNSRADFGAIVVHGHSIVTHPEFRPNRIGIDTGAYASGQLTCLVASATGMSLIQT